jgi:hypothetical protein
MFATVSRYHPNSVINTHMGRSPTVYVSTYDNAPTV